MAKCTGLCLAEAAIKLLKCMGSVLGDLCLFLWTEGSISKEDRTNICFYLGDNL